MKYLCLGVSASIAWNKVTFAYADYKYPEVKEQQNKNSVPEASPP